MSQSIRRMSGDDADFLRELGQVAFGEYDDRAGSHCSSLSQRPDSLTLVAVTGERPVGFAMVGFQAPSASLDAIAVAPESRGAGVGRRLLSAAETEAFKRGARVITLVTAEANLAALDLFLKAGYRIVKRHSRYYRRGQNAVAMRKRLG